MFLNIFSTILAQLPPGEPITFDRLESLMARISDFLMFAGVTLAVIFIVRAGITWMYAGADTKKIDDAKAQLKSGIIGAMVVLGVGVIINTIVALFGTSINPNQPLPGPGPGPINTTNGAVGNKCSGDRNCLSGFKCQDSICKRATGNWAGEPCNASRNCDVGLSCDKSGSAIQPIDGQTLGSCYNPGNVVGAPIGTSCTKDRDCISGLKCNQICQRNGGNLNGEACVKTASPSNCQSRACSTTGVAVNGICVPYSGT